MPKWGEGITHKPTCHARANALETRRDYILTSHLGIHSAIAHRVDPPEVFPTHRVVKVELHLNLIVTDPPKQFVTPTSAADMFDDEIAKLAGLSTDLDQPSEAVLAEVRKREKARLHGLMDDQLEARRHRLNWAHLDGRQDTL